MTATPLKIKFGASLKECLVASGKRQREMAELLGISSAAVSRVLHGKNTFSQKQLNAVIEWLKLNRTQSSQLSLLLNQIRNGESLLLSSFNRFLFSLRCDRGFSIPQLAEKTGISYARLMELEKNYDASPIYDEAVRLSTHLGCPLTELLHNSGYQLKDADTAQDINGVAECSDKWECTRIPLLSLETLAAYDPLQNLWEFGCASPHKLAIQKNDWSGLPVIAAECNAEELFLSFPGRVRLILCNKRPPNYTFFNLNRTRDGNFVLQHQTNKKIQTFRSAGLTADTSPIVWSVPVLELKLLPTFADHIGNED